MSAFVERLTTDWHPMRMIKLVFGIWALVQAVQVRDWAIGLLGAYFLYQVVTNTGCCGSQGCATPTRTRKDDVKGFTEYEEIK
jgi:hypothetical protein